MPDARSKRLRAAVQRARWLAELAGTLEEANRLLRHLNAGGEAGAETRALTAQVAALRREVGAIQRGHAAPGSGVTPDRIN
jgi:hypothetical protein